MSEKLFALLLLLYPARFRETHGEDALQLYRDRARHEQGLYARLWLWLDLLADFAVSVPREYVRTQPAFVVVSSQQPSGTPSFFVLSDPSPGFAALLSGTTLSLLAIGAFWISLLYFGNPAQQMTSTFAEPQSRSNVSKQQSPQSNPQEAGNSSDGKAMEHPKLDAVERQRVVEAAAKNLKQFYADPDIGAQTANSLLAHERNGDDNATTDGAAFADLLTVQMREVSHDKRLELVFSQNPLPEHPGESTPEDLRRYKTIMQQQNCTFEKVEMLPHAVGYFKLNSFPESSVCGQQAAAAMASLNGANAIIFDLRDNRGGFPDMVLLLASYLFDHPEYIYNPRESLSKQSWTHSPFSGSRLVDKPVYVLTSARTISAAEQFTYDLKMLKRATIVGEQTAGASHSAVFHRIDDHFGQAIAETKPINPFSETDWEGIGVEPDVKVKATDALQAAVKLAAARSKS